MRFAFLLCLLSCCAVVGPPHADDAPRFVAVLDAAKPFGPALATVDARAFIPLSGLAGPRWDGSQAATERLVSLGVARYAEPIRAFHPAFVPADPRLRDQWALADVEAPRAWNLAPSAAGTVVALLDTGVSLDHPDLRDALWTNENEAPDDALDNDDDGFPDDVHGWDFIDDDGNPSPDDASPADDHGTRMAGIIGAVSNNDVGISGVAPGVRVMPVRVMNGESGSSEALADGLDYAVNEGADVIDLSLMGEPSRLVDEALQRAYAAGVVVVAAAGNDGASVVSYPASSTVPGVLGVAATDASRALAPFSNFGAGVDLTAPGVDVLSTSGASGYVDASGTSVAAAFVAGAMALRLASRGRRDTSFEPMFRSLPTGPTGVPRLDVSALVEPEHDASPPISSSRSRLTFHAVAGADPPAQEIALASPTRRPFEIAAPDWLRVSGGHSSPCRLSLVVDPAGLASGTYNGSLILRPRDGSTPLDVRVELVVSTDHTLAIEARVDHKPVTSGRSLAIAAGTAVQLRAVRDEHAARVHWSVADEESTGARLWGVFARAGSYMVRARDEVGDEATLAVVVAGG